MEEYVVDLLALIASTNKNPNIFTPSPQIAERTDSKEETLADLQGIDNFIKIIKNIPLKALQDKTAPWLIQTESPENCFFKKTSSCDMGPQLLSLKFEVDTESTSVETENSWQRGLSDFFKLPAVGAMSVETTYLNEIYAQQLIQTHSLEWLQDVFSTTKENQTTLTPWQMNTTRDRVFDLVYRIKQDLRTGAPLFTFHAFENGNQAGNITLYGHPIVCRSEDGLRNNIVERQGIFDTLIIKTEELSDICKILPPDESALRYQSMGRSAAHGALRGSTNVIEQAMRQQGISQEASRYTSNKIYFIGYWLLSFMQHYQDYSSIPGEKFEDNTQAAFRAAINACYDVLYLFVVSAVCSGLSGGSQHVAQRAQSAGWTRTAQTVSFFGQHASKLIYAQGIRENGFVNTTLNVGSGTVAQQAIEYFGNKVLHPGSLR